MDKSVELNGLEHGYLALMSLWDYIDKINVDITVYEVRFAIFELLKLVNGKNLDDYELLFRYKIWLSIIDDYLQSGSQLDMVGKLIQYLDNNCREIIKDSET